MGTRANNLCWLICLLLLAVLPGCGLFESPDGVAGDSLAAPGASVRADSLAGTLSLELVSPGASAAGLPGPQAAPTPPDSMARAIAALVLQEMRTRGVDTLVVRIDTVRAARVDTLADKPVERIQEGLKNVGGRFILALFIVVGVYFLLRGLLWLLEAVAERSATRRLFFKRLIPIVRMVTWAIAIYFIITTVFQIDRNGLLAASAALGVGIGLAAQDLIKNLLGGIIIIFDAPFQVGDKVSVGGTYGEVKSIGLRSTRIVTLDDNLVSVPNSQVADSQVANANAGVLDCQVVTTLYLPGWVDASLAKKIAYEAAANSKYVFLDKPIVVHVRDEFKETFITKISVKAYVLDHLYESALATDITETAKKGFLEAGLLYPVYGLTHPEELLHFVPGRSAKSDSEEKE